MPTSHYFQLNEIVQLLHLTMAKSVLDVGVGFGKYGVLAREYLELHSERQEYDKWITRIDGIEVFDAYLTPLHDYIYDNIFVGEAIELLPTLETRYDLILLIDVLEHFTRADGSTLLEACHQRGRNVIVSTPVVATTQQAAFGNPYEAHKSQWERSDFEQGENWFRIPNHKSHIYLLGELAPKFKFASASAPTV